MTMDNVYFFLAFVLLTSIAAGLGRMLSGPAPADRILALQLSGTGGVATVLLLSEAADLSVLIDVALVYALLAAVTLVAFVKIYSATDDRPRRGQR
jgi:multicomponent Na+:H+ antiporter subunit F